MVAQIDRVFLRQVGRSGLWRRLLAYGFFEGRPATTRGRWINPLVQLNYRVASLVAAMRSAETAPVLILGTGRSGTTVLGMVLGAHPEVGFLNEAKALWAYAFAAEDLIGSYSNQPGRYRLDASDASRLTRSRVTAVYEWYATLTGCDVVVDKYPEILFRTAWVRAMWPDAKFVLILRDGMHTAASVDRWSIQNGQWRAGAREDWWGVNDRKWNQIVGELVPRSALLASAQVDYIALNNFGRALVEWICSVEHAAREVLPALDEKSLAVVKYEEMTRSPFRVFGALCGFLGVAASPEWLDYALRRMRRDREYSGPAVPSSLQNAYASARDIYESMRSL